MVLIMSSKRQRDIATITNALQSLAAVCTFRAPDIFKKVFFQFSYNKRRTLPHYVAKTQRGTVVMPIMSSERQRDAVTTTNALQSIAAVHAKRRTLLKQFFPGAVQ